MDATNNARITVIPELVHEISNHLTRSDFTYLIRVSKAWCHLWAPYLWRNIKILTYQQQSRFMNPVSQAALVRHRDREDNDQRAEALFVPLIGILGKSPSLVALDVPTLPPAGACVESLVKCIARSLPRLRRLVLFAEGEPYVRPHVAKEFLETCSAELEYLSIGIEFCQGGVASIVGLLDGAVVQSRPHAKLKCFALYSDISGDRDERIVPLVLSEFLGGCTNLEVADDLMHVLTFRESWMWGYTALKEILDGLLGVRLRQYYLRREVTVATREDEEVANEILGIFRDNSDTACSLSASAAGLAVMSVDKSDSLKSSDVQAILLHGRALRCMASKLPPAITITDMLQSPTWPCRWITTLKIQVAGILRPDIFTDYKNRLARILLGVSMKQSRSIQRQVYTQLASLVCLRELVLGADNPATDMEVTTAFDDTPSFSIVAFS
ncbi:hypothetical protein BGW39_011819 [Mortierella sp. 14UC]|nr:hypothetical protein BGW39_011819 [Mortierella sp. 14UC]